MKIILDFYNVNKKNQLYEIINNNISFNEYCNNLDALFDELTSITYDLQIIIKNINYIGNELSDYINILKNVFTDVQNECNNIKIIYENDFYK